VIPGTPPPDAGNNVDSLITKYDLLSRLDFHGKRAQLLYRGSEHGLTPQAFHARCDRHGNTLTIIESENGCIFGGFTPVKWDSCWGSQNEKSDPSGSSYLFSLKNPRDDGLVKFRVQDTKSAIQCNRQSGPVFGHELHVVPKSRPANCMVVVFEEHPPRSYSSQSDTGTVTATQEFFTGKKSMIVKEIEVFEIID
jgi:hypothetical protein